MFTAILKWRYRCGVATVPAEPSAPVRRRPKDRKCQVERAAAEAFSASGYHAVSMEAIAARVGISAAALYRHYPSKYDLFRGTVLNLGQQLVDAAGAADAPCATEALHRLVHSLIEVTLANRDSGGLYRWQARYLRAGDQEHLNDQLKVVNRRIQKPLTAIRPTLSSPERWMISTALLSVIGSVVDHRVRMEHQQIRALLFDVGVTVLSAELPAARCDRLARDPVPNLAGRQLFSDASVYEALLRAAMVLFNERGYRETRMEQIAAAVGMPASGVYRYFSGKGEILATVMRRAADRISGELSAILRADAAPRTALTQLTDAYVATAFANPELAFVYYTERVNLTPNDEGLLRNLQRSTIDSWVALLTAVRPELAATPARFLVHAAMAVVVDVGRLAHGGSSAGSGDCAHAQACVRRLMEVTLFGS
ncbi:MAG: TetR/AcrR family transcriptional regulator [Mycobacteriaceae bacterium]|nr:TetR/AcrR family transcriptional regulator [Mycobacteriaceae bacterium]